MSVILISFGLSLLVILQEPKRTAPDSSLSYLALTMDLTKKTFFMMKTNKDMMICMLLLPVTSGPLIVFEIYIMSWL